MIHFEGDQSFPLPLAEVASKLSDISFLVKCLPDSEIAEAGPDRAVWKMRPRLTFLTGSLTTEMTTVSREAGHSVAYRVFTKAIGATSTVTTALEFRESEDGGATIHWTGDLVEVTGLLKVVPKGLLQGTARKVIDDVWAAVREKVIARS
jgi:carbon monoxide dehydrogenase subunit G